MKLFTDLLFALPILSLYSLGGAAPSPCAYVLSTVVSRAESSSPIIQIFDWQLLSGCHYVYLLPIYSYMKFCAVIHGTCQFLCLLHRKCSSSLI